MQLTLYQGLLSQAQEAAAAGEASQQQNEAPSQDEQQQHAAGVEVVHVAIKDAQTWQVS